MSDDLQTNLAESAKRLGEARGLSQQRVAELAGVPRPTWASLESGSANPTLSVLSRAAAALQVSIEELVGPPRTSVQFFPAGFMPGRRRDTARTRKLLPESIPGLDISRWSCPPAAP